MDAQETVSSDGDFNYFIPSEKKYPFLKSHFRTRGGPLLNKIFAESRGGRHDSGVVVGRGEMVLPLMQRKLLVSYKSFETKAIGEQLVDQEQFCAAYYVNNDVLGWNTKLVKREDVPEKPACRSRAGSKRGNTERVQLAVAGEYPLIIAYDQTIRRMAWRGAPIDWLPLEAAVTHSIAVVIGSKASHTNAAGPIFSPKKARSS